MTAATDYFAQHPLALSDGTPVTVLADPLTLLGLRRWLRTSPKRPSLWCSHRREVSPDTPVARSPGGCRAAGRSGSGSRPGGGSGGGWVGGDLVAGGQGPPVGPVGESLVGEVGVGLGAVVAPAQRGEVVGVCLARPSAPVGVLVGVGCGRGRSAPRDGRSAGTRRSHRAAAPPEPSGRVGRGHRHRSIAVTSRTGVMVTLRHWTATRPGVPAGPGRAPRTGRRHHDRGPGRRGADHR